MYWKKNIQARIVGLILAILILVEASYLRYHSSTNEWSKIPLIIYAIFQDSISNIGIMLIVFPMLLSKYKPLGYILTMRGFSLLSHMLFPLVLLLPINFLRYYYELHQMLSMDYYQMIFYSIGSYIFSIPLSYLAFLLFRAPVQAFM